MRNFIVLSLFLSFVACEFVVDELQFPDENSSTEQTASTPTNKINLKFRTVTVESDLEANHFIKISDGFNIVKLSKGQCVRLRHEDKLVISLEEGLTISDFCSNLDESTTNNCKGNYRLVSTGDRQLDLEVATLPNQNSSCNEMFPIYTITMNLDLPEGDTVKIQNSTNVKNLTTKGQCVRMQAADFDNLQITVGKKEAGEKRQLLCGVNLPCEKKVNYEVHNVSNTGTVVGTPTTPYYALRSVEEANNNINCEWFKEL